jgi:bacterioferritin (cytochrome b1)
VAADLRQKADAVHWCTAWIEAFRMLEDQASVNELTTILQEELSHRDQLQGTLNRLLIANVTRGPARQRAG